MIKKVEKALKQYKMLEGVKEITVALSGGADSVSLLFVMKTLSEKYGYSLSAAHFNHGIRGAEADRDAEFCRNFCEESGIRLFEDKGNVPQYAKEMKISEETAARELRYKFLESVSNGKVATAHTASDNAETVLFNLARGSSASGIKGIPPARGNIIRPLIFCTRADIEKFCADNNLSYVTDSTNLKDDCSRNVIRHRVIPVLKDINSGFEDNCTKLSSTLNEDNDFINLFAEEEYKKRFCGNGIDLENFDKLHKAVAKRVIIDYYNYCLGEPPDNLHIEAVYDVCTGVLPNINVKKDFYAVRKNGFLKIQKSLREVNAEFICELKNIGIKEYSALKKSEKTNGADKINKLLLNSYIDCDKIVGKLNMIPKNSNDTLKLANSGCTKTLKKLITEKKIPEALRKNLPVFADDSGVVWAYGIGCADRVKIDADTNNVLLFNVKLKG